MGPKKPSTTLRVSEKTWKASSQLMLDWHMTADDLVAYLIKNNKEAMETLNRPKLEGIDL
jgi:hypothetical protein